MPSNTVNLTELETLAKELKGARDLVKERVTAFQEEHALLLNRRLPGIKSAVAQAKEVESELKQLAAAAGHLFVEPRTVVLHGIRVGLGKGKGRIEWQNQERVIELIKKHFPEQAAVLINTTEKPAKKALQALSGADLKRIGCTVTADGDVVIVKAVDDEVDKLVAALLNEEKGDGEE